MSDRFAEMGGIPVNDDGGEQVEPGHAVVLSFAGAVADFALAPDAERVLERVMSLAPVQRTVCLISRFLLGLGEVAVAEERDVCRCHVVSGFGGHCLVSVTEFDCRSVVHRQANHLGEAGNIRLRAGRPDR